MPVPLVWRTECWVQLGDLSAAVADLQAALEINPNAKRFRHRQEKPDAALGSPERCRRASTS
jgi:hypothetical protein